MAGKYRLRGLKGLWWEPDDYLEWPPLLAAAGYNFFLVCYTFCPETSLRWRRPLRPAEEERLRRLAADCAARGLELGLAINPCIGAQAWHPERAGVAFHPTSDQGWFWRTWQWRRPGERPAADAPLDYGSRVDLATLAEKCRRALALGVRTFALCLDDIEPDDAPAGFASLAAAQGWLVRELLAALRRIEPRARLLLTPTYYWSEGARAHPAYWAELAPGLPPEVDVFWTGEQVRSSEISAEQARAQAALCGRQPIWWFNYASNDSFRFALELPPAPPPAVDLSDELAGVLVNPMRQVRLTRLHALVMGEYLSDPAGYLHEPALGRAIRGIAGEAAPPLARYLAAWSAYPDPRRLPAALASGDGSRLDALVAAMSRSVDAFGAVLPELDRLLGDRAMFDELAAGARRFHLLRDALALQRDERDQGAAALAERRARLERALMDEPDETACDARAVLARPLPAGPRSAGR